MTEFRKQSFSILNFWLHCLIFLYPFIYHTTQLPPFLTFHSCTKSSACNTQKKKQKYAILVGR